MPLAPNPSLYITFTRIELGKLTSTVINCLSTLACMYYRLTTNKNSNGVSTICVWSCGWIMTDSFAIFPVVISSLPFHMVFVYVDTVLSTVARLFNVWCCRCYYLCYRHPVSKAHKLVTDIVSTNKSMYYSYELTLGLGPHNTNYSRTAVVSPFLVCAYLVTWLFPKDVYWFLKKSNPDLKGVTGLDVL